MSELNISRQAESNSAQTKKLSHTTTIVLTAMFTALVYVFTMIHINPFGLPGGLVHLGNIPFFVAAILFDKKVGMISGGVGMALFDIFSPYGIWAPFTLVIGFATAYVISLATSRHKRFLYYLLAFILAAIVKVVGYYIAEGIIYGNWIAPIQAVPANLIQVGVASVIVLLIIEPLRFAAERTILRGHS